MDLLGGRGASLPDLAGRLAIPRAFTLVFSPRRKLFGSRGFRQAAVRNKGDAGAFGGRHEVSSRR